jgi:L-2,4-diaminobutyrate decarboxylase
MKDPQAAPAPGPIWSGASPEKIAEDLRPLLDFQEQGLPLEELIRLFEQRLTPHLVRYDRPAFQSLYNFLPEKGAQVGAALALRWNQGVTNWIVSPGGVMLEEMCGHALCRLFELGARAGATFMYCGTYANQQALYLALHRAAEKRGFDFALSGLAGFSDPGRLRILASEDAHFSLRHAVRILGLGEDSLVPVPVDADRRMDARALAKRIDSLQSQRDAVAVVATAGTTSTASVDPIPAVVEACRKLGAWCHIDAAYGFSYKLLPECAPLFEGAETADSITWDPHKNFGVPIPSSLLFLREAEDFERMAIFGKYFNRAEDPEPNPGLKSPPSTRPLTALPLVATLLHQGLEGMRERLRGPYEAVRRLAETLAEAPDIELAHRPDLSLLCLRIRPAGVPPERLDDLQRYIHERIKREARRSISISRLNDRTVLRLVAISPGVTFQALMDTIQHARDLAREWMRDQAL